jgi:hypothetical protein
MRSPFFFFAFACLVVPGLSPAQQPQLNWDETYYTGNGTNIGKRVVMGEEDDVYVLGDDGFSAYLARYRSYDGLPQWQVQWDSATAAVDLVRASNGNLIAAWEYYNQPFNSPLDIGVGAWSSEGDPLWTFFWNDSLNRDDIVRDVHLDGDGNILICATTEELSGNPSVFNNISVLKLDPSGDLLWRRTWNGTINNDDEPNAIWCDEDDNIYVGGYTTNAGLNGQDMVLLKYSPDGVLQWDESINRNSAFGSHVDIATHVQVHPDGKIIVAGVTESPGSANGQDFSIYAFDADGNIQWPYHFNQQNDEFLRDLEIGEDGDMYLLGRYSSFTESGEVVVRVDPGGSTQWSNTYATGSLDARFPSALALSPDGNTITTGWVGDQLLRDAYVRAYDPDGEAIWTYRYTATNSFNEEEGHDVAVSAENSIFITGMYDQSGQSLIRGVTFCLCPVSEGVCLLPPISQPIGMTGAMAGLDIDQDGWRDMVFTTPLQNVLDVRLGSSGGFVPTFPIVVPAECSLLEAADLDMDGDEDVVAGTYGGGDLHLLLNTSGTLGVNATIPVAQGVLDLLVTQLDGMNGPEIVIVLNAAPYLIVHTHNGGTNYTATFPEPIDNPYSIAGGDVDGDGITDLVIGRSVQDSIYALYGDGSGGFSEPDGFESGSFFGPALVGIGDMDFDGINDLVTFNGSNTWAARRGLGGGNFAPAISGNAGAVHQFLIAPFAEDSLLSMITGNWGSTNTISYSPCSHTYPHVPLVTTGAGNHLIEVADWTNDGSPDLLSFYTQGEIRLWRNCDTLGVITEVLRLDLPARGTLLLHPSPATDHVTVVRPPGAIGLGEIVITSAQGEIVSRVQTSSATETLAIDDLSAGIYVIAYSVGTNVWSGRVAVLRE